MRPEYDLLKADVQVRGANPFGRLDAASLQVSARLLPLPPGRRTATCLRQGAQVLPVWKYWPKPGCLVYIVTDWACPSSREDNNTGPLGDDDNYTGEGGLQLMLLSSCCTYHGGDSEGNDTDKQITETAGIWWTYQGMIYQYLYPGKVVCHFCSNFPGVRDAWGLLLLPSGKDDGSYYRVGMWFSYARVGGGLSTFDDIEKQGITLV